VCNFSKYIWILLRGNGHPGGKKKGQGKEGSKSGDGKQYVFPSEVYMPENLGPEGLIKDF